MGILPIGFLTALLLLYRMSVFGAVTLFMLRELCVPLFLDLANEKFRSWSN